MKSRKDQVQAYFFVVGRLAAAVTHGKPDNLESPSKRMTTGMVLGFVLAAVTMGVFGIFGLFVPSSGNSSWKQDGAIVMDETSGARYVYLAGQLRPVLNYSSARLVAGNSGGQLTSVSPAALAGTPVGQPVGIAGAPDSLPAADKVTGAPWTVCTQRPGSASTTQNVVVSVLLGHSPGAALSESQAYYVSAPGGELYLVTRGKRFKLPSDSAAVALGYGALRPLEVPSLWLNTIPQGPDFVAPPVPGLGRPGPPIGGRPSVVGQIYQARNPAIGTEQNYLVRQDGLAALSRTAAALLLTAPSTRQAYPDGPIEAIQITPDALTGLAISTTTGIANDLPPSPPDIVAPPPGSQPCARHDPGTGQTVAEWLPDGQVAQASVPLGTHEAGTTADRVAIPAGRGVLAHDQSAPGAAAGVTYLVTEVGEKYPLADAATITALGYSESAAVGVPMRLLDLLPTGPVLSADAARQAQGARP
ncbi:type VII secretion protein EccB [Amycolatopsis orientalis]|uniref:Type VII secretion protein EccB n=1 Tax=Amycolatopsis orientalis TaxID=31958 RepID=A0A193BUK1_AMYOR|nr:type VII secretion protein EccB [Amycolatopsis orientalis]ANN15901.1 type VII secretion protein EccB [Amycolatopsis orientalis]